MTLGAEDDQPSSVLPLAISRRPPNGVERLSKYDPCRITAAHRSRPGLDTELGTRGAFAFPLHNRLTTFSLAEKCPLPRPEGRGL